MRQRRALLSLGHALLASLVAIAVPASGQAARPGWEQRFQEFLGAPEKIPAAEAESRYRALLKEAATAEQRAAVSLAIARLFADGPDERRREADPFFAAAVQEGSGRFALDARNAWGVALLRQQRYGEAVEVLAEMHRSQALAPEVEAPARARYLYNYGAALERTGQIREAISLYEQALRYDPGFERASNDLLRSTLEMAPFGPVWYVPAPAPTFIAALDSLFSPLLESGRIDTASRYLEFLWDQRLVLVDRENVFPRWAYWLVRYLAIARMSRTDFELKWLPRLQDPRVDEAVRRSPWLGRIREAYQTNLPLVLDPARARYLTSPWSSRAEEAAALSELFRMAGDIYRDLGDRPAALSRYALAWGSAGNWKAGLYLTELVQRAPAELDADGRILATLAAASARGEMAPTDVEGWHDLSRFHVLLARIHDERTSSEAALDAWKRAVDAHEKANALASTPEPAPGLYAGLGEACLQANRPGDATLPLLTAAEQYLAIERPAEARREVRSLLSAAALQMRLDDQRAEATYDKALTFAQRLGDPELRALALQGIGSLQIRRQDFASARINLQQALDIWRETGDHSHELRTLQGICELEAMASAFDKAASCFNEVLAGYHSTKDRPGMAAALIGLATTYSSLGEPIKARASSDQALAISRELKNPWLELDALVTLADIGRRSGQLQQALAQTNLALALIEGLPAQSDPKAPSMTPLEARAYQTAIDLRMELNLKEPAAGHAAEAFEIHERSLARRLRHVLVDAGVLPATLQGDDRRLERLARPRIRTLAEIQALLDPDTLLLEYALGEERSYLWALTSKRLTLYDVPPRRQIESLVRRVVEGWSRSPEDLPRQSIDPVVQELRRGLLAPLATEFRVRRLVIVPDGAIQYVPFGALPVPASSRHPGLVVDDFEVVTLPSASALADLRGSQDRRPTPNLLAVLADDGSSDHLPNSRQEAKQIAALVSVYRPEPVLLNLKADRNLVTGGELANFRVIHLAAHGHFDAGSPDLSSLSLYPRHPQENLQPDRFGLRDIYGLDLKAELVVLSGSQASLEGNLQGEGLVGLTRGFLNAGAKRLIVSLWAVDDRATVELMSRFYRELLEGGLPPAAALRQAQLAIRHMPGWEDPHFWAPFIFQGDWIGQPLGLPGI